MSRQTADHHLATAPAAAKKWGIDELKRIAGAHIIAVCGTCGWETEPTAPWYGTWLARMDLANHVASEHGRLEDF